MSTNIRGSGKHPTRVWIQTFGWPMDEGRYDVDPYDHERLLHYLISSYENLVGRRKHRFSAFFSPLPAIGQVN